MSKTPKIMRQLKSQPMLRGGQVRNIVPPAASTTINDHQRTACARSALQARKHTAAGGNDASAPSSTALIQQAYHGMKREARNRGCQAANSPLASNDTGDMAPSLRTARKPLSYHSTTVCAFARTPLSPIGPVQASRPPHSKSAEPPQPPAMLPGAAGGSQPQLRELTSLLRTMGGTNR